MNLGFFGPKMAVSWRITSFQKKIAWNPYFYSVFGCAFSGPRCQKRQFLDTLSKKKRKFWLITEKLFFGIFVFFTFSFLVFLFVLFFVVFLFCLFCFVFVLFLFGGFKGQVRWPKGPPHLALNPPYFFVFVFFCFVFFGGFKGQVRWPKGPPHLALNPPYFHFFFLVFVFFFALHSLFLNRQKNLFFPLEKGIFC